MATGTRTRSIVVGSMLRVALAILATAVQQGCMLNPNKYDASHLPAGIYGTPDEDQPFVPGPEFKLARQAAAMKAAQAQGQSKQEPAAPKEASTDEAASSP